MAPWLEKIQSKKHNLPDITLEDNRIKIVGVREKKQILTESATKLNNRAIKTKMQEENNKLLLNDKDQHQSIVVIEAEVKNMQEDFRSS